MSIHIKMVKVLATTAANSQVAWTITKGEICIDLLLRDPEGTIFGKINLFRVKELDPKRPLRSAFEPAKGYKVVSNIRSFPFEIGVFQTMKEALAKAEEMLFRKNVLEEI